MLNARDLGATGNGFTDDTAALQRAIGLASRTPGGATVFLPAGKYAVSGLSLRPTGKDDFTTLITLCGEGSGRTVVLPLKPECLLIDAVGCSNLTLRELSIDSGRLPSAAALMLGRLRSNPNCANGNFIDVVICGSFSVAAVISIGAESMRWINCRISNGHTKPAHLCFLTSHRLSDINGIDLADMVDGPNTDNVMVGCSFYTPHANAVPIKFSGSGGFSFFGCSILGGEAQGVRLVVYDQPDDGVFNGPVHWHGCHFEATGPDCCVHWISAPLGLSYWRNIAVLGANVVVSSDTALLDFDRTEPRRQPVIEGMQVNSLALPPGIVRVNVHTFALTGSTINTLSNSEMAVIALGFVRDCSMETLDLRTPQIAGRVTRVTRDASRRQTFGSACIVENADVNAGPTGTWIVQRGGAGTIVPQNQSQQPLVGEVVGSDTQSQIVWHRSKDGRLTLVPPSDNPLGITHLSPKLLRF